MILPVENKIYTIRNAKVMLDFDLASLYQIENRVLKQAVRRNIERFPDDFMFQLTNKEVELLVSQNVIPSKSKFGGALPFAFTEQGVAMLSSVVKSKTAIQVNIAIMRAFVTLRKYALDHQELTQKMIALENKYDQQFKDIFEAINYLISNDNEEDLSNRTKIGFKTKK